MTTTPGPADDATLRVTSSSPLTPVYPSDSQFAPGTILAGRYRVVSMLGKGGMGEVYRADDLKLGQPVALKFLPRALGRNAILLNHLHEEVRMGRQVTHPNVCRIYDIGEEASGHFVVMEFVDGEDLGRLLRRIGRLPHDKAVEIARGVAAGLAAAHAKGILHRDLKPANVMIDAHGESRITDFGLALPADEAQASDVVVGTPAYLAPEQLEGQPASVQSDLYALGLVMYEIFTGRRARSGRTLQDAAAELTTNISRPSTHVRDLDPAVERIITRCLDRDPAQRPRSAREVFQALPGESDPLRAAIAAGETPSPRAIAAAGAEGTLSRAAAWSWVAAFVVLLAAVLAITSQWRITSLITMDKAPAVLDEHAAEIARAAGVSFGPIRIRGFEPNHDYLTWVERNVRSHARFTQLERGPSAITYWVRASSSPLTSPAGDLPYGQRSDPPRRSADDTTLELSPDGRLVSFAAAPAAIAKPRTDWAPLFAAARLDVTKLRRVAPHGVAPPFAEERAAWDGVWPDDPAKPLHVEAAAAHNVPVWFHAGGPWEERTLDRSFSNAGLSRYLILIGVAVFSFAALLAWRNLRLGRGDRSGAVRVGVAIAAIDFIAAFAGADHRLFIEHESAVLTTLFESALFLGAMFAFFYIALEPTIRRRAPHLLIAWSRLLAGRWRDPLVGRSILIGAACGAFHAAVASAGDWLPGHLGLVLPPRPHVDSVRTLAGVRFALSMALHNVSTGTFFAFALTILLAAMLLLLRRRWLAVSALFVLQAMAYVFAAHGDPYIVIGGPLLAAVTTALLVRVGPLGVVAAHMVFALTFLCPVSLDVATPYAPALLTPLVLAAILVIFAFRVSLGAQPVFGTLED